MHQFIVGYRFNIDYWKSNFVYFRMAIKKAGLLDLMFIIKKKNLHIARKIGLVGSMLIAATKLNHISKFCITIYINLVQVKLLNKSVIRLNHRLELF